MSHFYEDLKKHVLKSRKIFKGQRFESLMTEKNEVRIDNNPDKIKMKGMIDKCLKECKKNPWVAATIVLAVVLVVMFLTGSSMGGVSAEEAGQRLVEFAAANGAEAELVEVNEKAGMYEVVISMQGQEVPLYVTKSGDYFTQALVPLQINDASSQPSEPAQPQDIPKSDKPTVELFVMTHCPYGTQAEKGMIPTLEALGNKIDGSIKFVHYFMHEGPGEEPEETPRQVCIREEQGDKYLDYLKCFLEGNGESPYVGKDPSTCMQEVGIDETKVTQCISSGKADEYYAADSELSQGYGVQGSPSLVVNGMIVSSARDSASYLSAICSAFNAAPEECNEALSSASPSPGFGYSAAGSDTQAQC